MTVTDLVKFFNVKNPSQLSQRISVARSTLTEWEGNGIPPQIQATFELQTNGALKADRSALNLRYKAFRISDSKQSLTA